MDDQMDFEQLRKRVEEATDPKTGAGLVAALQGDMLSLGISEARQAAATLHGIVDDQETVHDQIVNEELGDSLRKLDKNVMRLMDDLARACERFQRCTCDECKTNAAPYN